jgi:hypothetical protein
MELNDPNQEICENCGKVILIKKTDKKSEEEPTLIRDNYKEHVVRKRRSWRCC